MKTFIVGSLAATWLIADTLINPSQVQTQTNQQQNQPGTRGKRRGFFVRVQGGGQAYPI